MRLGEQVRSEEEMECDKEGLCDLTVQDRKVAQIVIQQDYQGDQGQTLIWSNITSLIQGRH